MLAMDGVCVTGTLEGEAFDASILPKRGPSVTGSVGNTCSELELLSSGTVARGGRLSIPWGRWPMVNETFSMEGEVGESGRVVIVACLTRRLCILPSDWETVEKT